MNDSVFSGNVSAIKLKATAVINASMNLNNEIKKKETFWKTELFLENSA